LVLAAAGAAAAIELQSVPAARSAQGLGAEPDEIFIPGNEIPESTFFGETISRSGNTLLVGLPGYKDQTGRVAVFTRNKPTGEWKRDGSIDSPSGQPQEAFGFSVAFEDNVAVSLAADALFVFRHKHSGFALTQTLSSTASHRFDRVTLWHKWAFVSGVENGQNVIHVFKVLPAGFLVPVQKLHSDGSPDDGFGTALAVSNGTLVVGAPGDDETRGAAYIFELRAGHGPRRWVRSQKIVVPGGASLDSFGTAVAVGNGVLAIGAPGEFVAEDPDCGFGVYFGATYVLRRAGGEWTQQQKLMAPRCQSGFGALVAVGGEWLIGAAPSSFPEQGGQPVVYQKNANGAYAPLARVENSAEEIFDVLYLSGQTLYVGRPFERGDFAVGAVNIFDLDNLTFLPAQ